MRVGLAVIAGVHVGEAVEVTVTVAGPVAVEVAVAVGVKLGVAVTVAVLVAATVGVEVEVAVTVANGPLAAIGGYAAVLTVRVRSPNRMVLTLAMATSSVGKTFASSSERTPAAAMRLLSGQSRPIVPAESVSLCLKVALVWESKSTGVTPPVIAGSHLCVLYTSDPPP